MLRLLPICLLVSLFALSARLHAQEGGAGIIHGEVIGGLHGPLAGATVVTSPATRSVVTDSSGRFVLDGIEEGRYVVTVMRDGRSVSFEWQAREAQRPVTVRLPIWELVWHDEFDSTAVDETLWEIPDGPTGVPDHRFRFRRRALTVEKGRLRITSVPDSLEPDYYQGGQVVSREKFMYGRFEARAKLPTGRGLWPGIWFWSHHNAPELDIIELLGKDPTTLHHTYHYGNHRGTRRSRSTTSGDVDYSKAYHRYALEWYPNEYVWYVDDVEVFRAPVLQPDEPLSFVLSTFVGGSWGGFPDETNVWPQFHDIDYARIYRTRE